jgi:DNA-binding Lrp family transcriptional regulator
VRVYAGKRELRSTVHLSDFDKRLCNTLQNGIPLTRRPYEKIAQILKSSETKVLEHTRKLIRHGVIRRLGVSINWRATGKESTLVAAHIEQKNLKKVVGAVNKLQGVSHNYLREHHFNLWFTLRADSQKEIEKILKKLSNRFGVEFRSLPAVRVFKLEARFDAESGGHRLLPEKYKRRTLNIERRTSNSEQKINEIDKRILEKLLRGLKVVKRPFDFLGENDFEVYDALIHIGEMMQDGVIRRLGAMANHHKLGFTANAMLVCKVDKARMVKVGQRLAKLPIVSHCYQRQVFKGWPYNLFAMCHGRSRADIRKIAEKFARKQHLSKWELLTTSRRLLYNTGR